MSILTLCIVVIVAGILLWAVTNYVPMAPPVKGVLTGIVVIFLVLLALQAFGVLGHVGSVRLR